MIVELHAQDCSRLSPQPSNEEAAWLRGLAARVHAGRHVLSLSAERDRDEPIVYCERDGAWWTGRYIGSVTFKGGRLTILPRLGLSAIRSWLYQASNVALVETPGDVREDASFIVQLVAAVWARSFVEAARHGLPALRRHSRFTGYVVRGRLDVRGTVRLRSSGRSDVASVLLERSLDHAASRAIVAGYAVLQRWMTRLRQTERTWLPARARELLPRLVAVTGARPAIPTELELRRVRYTPITAGFRALASLSRRVALQRGVMSDPDADGTSTGVLLDVAELWERYVLAVLRHAAAGLDVRHGTSDPEASQALLASELDGGEMGTLKPDAVVFDGRQPVAVVDAKYKRLEPRASAPHGPQREDLYQVTSYLGRYGRDVGEIVGALAYPQDPSSPAAPPAEERSPWRLDPQRRVYFVTLPHDLGSAAEKLARILRPVRDQARDARTT